MIYWNEIGKEKNWRETTHASESYKLHCIAVEQTKPSGCQAITMDLFTVRVLNSESHKQRWALAHVRLKFQYPIDVLVFGMLERRSLNASSHFRVNTIKVIEMLSERRNVTLAHYYSHWCMISDMACCVERNYWKQRCRIINKLHKIYDVAGGAGYDSGITQCPNDDDNNDADNEMLAGSKRTTDMQPHRLPRLQKHMYANVQCRDEFQTILHMHLGCKLICASRWMAEMGLLIASNVYRFELAIAEVIVKWKWNICLRCIEWFYPRCLSDPCDFPDMSLDSPTQANCDIFEYMYPIMAND